MNPINKESKEEQQREFAEKFGQNLTFLGGN